MNCTITTSNIILRQKSFMVVVRRFVAGHTSSTFSKHNNTTTTIIPNIQQLSSTSSSTSSSSLNTTSSSHSTAVLLSQQQGTKCYLSSLVASGGYDKSDATSTTTNTTTPTPIKMKYAIVNHTNIYETQMSGLHGKQLNLAFEECKRNDGKYLPDHLLDDYSVTLDDLLLKNNNNINKENDNNNISELDEVEEEEEEHENETDDDDDEDEDDLTDDEYIDNDEMIQFPSRQISKDDQIAYKAGAASGGNFAVICLNNGTTQHKVALDDVVVVNKLKPLTKWNVGETITLEAHEVLLLGSTKQTIVGLPGITSKGGTVKVHVEEITRDATTITFKKRRKKHSQRKRGSRRDVTFLRIVDININDNTNEEDEKEEKSNMIMEDAVAT